MTAIAVSGPGTGPPGPTKGPPGPSTGPPGPLRPMSPSGPAKAGPPGP